MSFVQKAATVFGVVFVVVGILGFVPAFTPNGHLLGIFEVDSVHNVIHLLSGVVALLAATTHKNARLYFQVFGIVYGLVTIAGVISGENSLFGFIAHNVADIFLHAIITIAALYLGFGTARDDMHVAKTSSM
jgi:hypothetical protein